MVLNYTANASAANHVDVLAAISDPVWVEGEYTLLPHIDQGYLTFKKVAPVPDEVTIEKIEFQNVGKAVNLPWLEIPTATTKNGKPKFVWSDVATGRVASTLTGNKMVTEDATLMGDTFLMLPTDAFSATAKIVVTTNFGDREFCSVILSLRTRTLGSRASTSTTILRYPTKPISFQPPRLNGRKAR